MLQSRPPIILFQGILRKFLIFHTKENYKAQRIGGMFWLPILKHKTVKLHESLLSAETLKPALSRL